VFSKKIILIILLDLCIVFPTTILNSDVEYIRLHSYYKWMTFKIFNSMYYWCDKYKVSIDDLVGLAHDESRGDPNAISIASARGILQVMPFHYNGDPNDLFNIDLNIKLGTSYYKFCLDHCKGDLECTIKSYNSGHNYKEFNNWNYLRSIKKNSNITKENKEEFYEYR